MQTVPNLLKHKNVNTFHLAVTRFIWVGKRPQILLTKLPNLQERGGVNLPHVKGYDIACLSRHLRDWINQTGYYSNYKLESALVGERNLVALLYAQTFIIAKGQNNKGCLFSWQNISPCGHIWIPSRIKTVKWKSWGIRTISHLLHTTEIHFKT